MRNLKIRELASVSGGLVGSNNPFMLSSEAGVADGGVVQLPTMYVTGQVVRGPYEDYQNGTLFFSRPGWEAGVPWPEQSPQLEPGLQTVFTIPFPPVLRWVNSLLNFIIPAPTPSGQPQP